MQCRICKRALTPLDLTVDASETKKVVFHETFGYACLSHEGVAQLYLDLMLKAVDRPAGQKILLIDDLRTFESATQTARNYAAGLDALRTKKWDVLYLDHDLGSPNFSETGYDILCWLEQNKEHLPGEIVLVTANPAGAERMKTVLRKLYPNENH